MSHTRFKKILIMAGGTGGHIFPGIAIGQALSAEGVEVRWLGSEVGMEKQLVAGRFPIHCVSITGVRRAGLWAKLTLPSRLLKATMKALKIIRQFKPDCVLAMGGFVSGPGGLAAFLSRTPLVVHEQNAIAGMTNRYLARLATKVLTAYPNVFPENDCVTVVGNPVRAELAALPSPEQRLMSHKGALRVLVLGGSRGAKALNTGIIEWLKQIEKRDQVSVWHQTGESDFKLTQAAYQSMSSEVKVEPFIEDMAAAYEWADVMICRSGALTVAEIAVVGMAAIFVPYPYAVDNHQFYNALFLKEAGAATIIEEKQLTSDKLTSAIMLLQDRKTLLQKTLCAKAQGMPDAVSNIIKCLNQICGEEKCENVTV